MTPGSGVTASLFNRGSRGGGSPSMMIGTPISVNADVALTYAPRGDVTLTARAQHLRQLPGEQSGMGGVSLEYDRTTFVVSVAWRFPERLAAEIPMRDSLRVDRSDNTPVGDEVAPSTAP